MKLRRIAIDPLMSVFTFHGVDGQERAMLRRNLRRQEVVSFRRIFAPRLPA